MKSFLRLFAVLAFALPSVAVFTPSARAGVSEDVTALTGAHTRVVWVRDAALPSDPLAERAALLLMGFDNRDGRAERPILPKPGSFFRPLITADGQRVVFSNLVDKKIYVVNWDGSGLKAVVDNALFADVFTDAKTGVTWIYAQTSADGRTPPPDSAWKEIVATNNSQKEFPVVRRFRLDNPAVSEVVWDKSPVAQFQVSPAGIYASGSSGDGEGLFTLPNGEFMKFYGGCWPSMAPDGSQRVWVFTGSHKSAHIFTQNLKDKKQRTSSPLAFLNAPGVPSSNEMYHPRWGNHIRFMTITGPYWYKDWDWRAENKLTPEAAAKAEIYLARLNPDLDLTEAWVRLTDNKVGDFFGDSWIDLKENPQPVWTDTSAASATPAAAEWPGKRDGLVFLWENNTANNQIELAGTGQYDLCNLTPRGHALWGRHNVMDTAGGSFLADDSRNAAILKAVQASGEFSIEAVIQPAQPDATGVMLLSFGNNLALEQAGPRLLLHVRSSATAGKLERFDLAPWLDIRGGLKPGTPVHVIISYAAGVLSTFTNGNQRGITDRLQGNLSVWEPASLLFGDVTDGGKNWAGTLEDVTIYSRRITPAEARQRYAALQNRLKERQPPAQITLKVKLISTTAAPEPASIAPYRRCLSVNVYEIEQVEKGTLSAKRIAVAHWSILDAQVVPAFTQKTKGQTLTLTLDRYEDHPELESERLVTDMDDEGLPLFYDSTR